jgi:hypothetical protein
VTRLARHNGGNIIAWSAFEYCAAASRSTTDTVLLGNSIFGKLRDEFHDASRCLCDELKELKEYNSGPTTLQRQALYKDCLEKLTALKSRI